ncbi:MAG: DNA primase [Armatimonadetes bacterium]|nr:DNA primase [Armatimonadota bacterium]
MAADKEEVRSRTDIVDLIGAHVQLKRRGRNWLGLCPFHQEKTPSFHVDPVTQSFKCFGCGVGGDAFSFVQRMENMSFIEAAERLAARAGLEFARTGGSSMPTGERDALLQMNMTAKDYYRSQLAHSSDAQAYLDRRGITADSVLRWGLGYAPESWDALITFLRSRQLDLRVAAQCGLVGTKDGSRYYDVFRNRLIFPIHDEQERIVGFGGRAVADEEPKYLNSPESALFAKSKLLYGLPFARRSVAASGRSILMEGYMDVIAAHQSGFTGAMATLGTSLTGDHAKKLVRLAPIVVLCYDADRAGIKATLRAAEILEQQELQVRVISLPAGEDPDSLLRKRGAEAFEIAVAEAVGRVEYQLRRAVEETDTAAPEGQTDLLRKLIAILASVPSRTERDMHMEKVWSYHPMRAHGASIVKDQLHRDAEEYARRLRAQQRAVQSGEPPPAPPPAPQAALALTAERRAELLLVRALVSVEHRADVLGCCAAGDFFSTVASRLFEAVRAGLCGPHTDESGILAAVDAQGDEVFSDGLRQLLQESSVVLANIPLSSDFVRVEAKRLRRARVAQVQDQLAGLLRARESFGPEDERHLAEYMRVLRELKGSSAG